MTERTHAFVAACLVVAVVVGGVAAVSVDASASEGVPDAPVSVEETFVGTSADADHAVAVTVTVAPTERTGPIDATELTLATDRAAFIAPSSISTSETTGGEQVIDRTVDRPPTFDLGRLEPGETASISFRVYPKSVLPQGETLATVHVETQFARTQRVVETSKRVAPTVTAEHAAYGITPTLSPLTSGAIGAAAMGALALVAGAIYRRRLRAATRSTLQSVADQPLTASAERAVADAIRSLGGSTRDDQSGATKTTTGTGDDPGTESVALDLDD